MKIEKCEFLVLIKNYFNGKKKMVYWYSAWVTQVRLTQTVQDAQLGRLQPKQLTKSTKGCWPIEVWNYEIVEAIGKLHGTNTILWQFRRNIWRCSTAIRTSFDWVIKAKLGMWANKVMARNLIDWKEHRVELLREWLQ